MRRLLRPLLLTLLLPVLLLAALLLAANTDPGRRLIVWGLGEVTGGELVLSGLSGTLPGAPRIGRLELRDADGAWLLVEDMTLAIDPLQLLRGKVAIEALNARSVALRRLPARAEDDTAPIQLPVRILLGRLVIDDLSLAGAVPGAPRLTIDGSGAVASAQDVQATVLMTAPGRTDHYRLEVGIGEGQYRLDPGAPGGPRRPARRAGHGGRGAGPGGPGRLAARRDGRGSGRGRRPEGDPGGRAAPGGGRGQD